MHRAKEFSDQYNIPNTFTYEQLYKSNLVDVVYIATPHNFHYEQCLSCMENGKAVLCEKPVTINDGQFKSLVTLANKRKVFFMEAVLLCYSLNSSEAPSLRCRLLLLRWA